MASDDEKKKYWCDQIKTMIGPCMITFAIPMMIPGFTITFVAFAEEDSFEKYGVLHIVGILILGISIVLVMLGCILRFYWKPFISPDIEMHLSPKRTQRLDESGARIMSPQRHILAERETVPLSRRSSLRSQMDPVPVSVQKTEKSESETEGTGSESELKKLTGTSTERNFDIMASPRSRNLMPVNSEMLDDTYNGPTECRETQSYEALKEFRRKKKAKKRTKQTINEGAEVNTENMEADENYRVKPKIQNPDEKRQRRKKKKKRVLKSLKAEQRDPTADDSSQFLPSVFESNQPNKCENITDASHKQLVLDKTVPRRFELTDKDGGDSDHSSVSIGSADSVLAQYTSRSGKGHDD